MSRKLKLAGIDLAWQGESNPSAIAVGTLDGNKLELEEVIPAITGLSQIFDCLHGMDNLTGLAIDASLIINNKHGKRACELELSKVYSSRWASCHATNQTLYPNAFSVRLASLLESAGFEHLGMTKWQIECYPHASIIECFGLARRLLYKKGSVSEKKNGQKRLSSYISKLADSPSLPLSIPEHLGKFFASEEIEKLKGQALKSNEDSLDAVMCLYTAGLYAVKAEGIAFGNSKDGYIWVPQGKCI